MRPTVLSGVLLALGAAVAFGVTTPVVAWLGAGVGPFSTAALLYAGAAMLSLASLPLVARSGRALRCRDVPWVALIAALGAGAAPTLFAWGVQRAGAVVASLALNAEVVFTLALAWIVHRERAGVRVVAGALAMIAGGVALAVDTAGRPTVSMLGLGSVILATLAWAGDNTATRRLSENDPSIVVLAKGGAGAVITSAIAVAAGEPTPSAGPALGLLACGATGYGLSLRLYLLAQRRFGAGRTASVFGVAPFVGAGIGFAIGDRGGSLGLMVGAACFGFGMYLHATERHAHTHTHMPLDHEHAHRHDDGHHDHMHDPPIVGEHTHLHHHDALTHDHDHVPDEHHNHEHRPA